MITKNISFLENDIREELENYAVNLHEHNWCYTDRWLLASCLQKAIRRGHGRIALSSAVNLYQLDKRMLQRRLLVTAYEDIGMGDLKALAYVTHICTDTLFRKSVGELKSYLYAASLLAGSHKCRATDQLYMICNHAEEGQEIREAINELSIRDIMRCALDNKSELYTRAYAAQKLHADKACNAITFMEQLPVSPPVIDICSVATSKMRDPLPVFIPLILFRIVENTILNKNDTGSPDPSKIPPYAFDPLHTRSGKEAVRLLRNEVSELRPFTVKQIGKAIFHTESVLCDRELSSPELDDLKAKNVEVSLRHGATPLDRHHELLSLAIKHMFNLNLIRAEAYQNHKPHLPSRML